MELDVIRELNLSSWSPTQEALGGETWEKDLEAGRVLFFPQLAFNFSEDERCFLTERWSDGKSKNISYRGSELGIQGATGSEAEQKALETLIARFSSSAKSLVDTLFPAYRPYLKTGFTSYRTARVEGRVTSWRKDDTRLHVDSFPSNPTQGTRLLRVFTNVNPEGIARTWRVGEPFEDHAKRFIPKASSPLPGSAWLMEKIGITKARRSEYDHYMGQLHDLGKADMDYQAHSPQLTFEFPPGSSWVVFSDQVLHAVMGGQFMLEQTFYLSPEHLIHPELGPLKVLERLTGKTLCN